MKGVGTTISAIIVIVMLIAVTMIFILSLKAEANKEQQSILKSAELVSVKNTFYLLEKSLNMTWFVSTIQCIFSLQDHIDDHTDSYWYRTDPKSELDVDENGQIILPGDDVCNNANPRVCLPKTEDISGWLNEEMRNYINPIKTGFETNGIKIRLENIDSDLLWPAYGRIISVISQDIRIESSNTILNANTISENNIFTNYTRMLFAGWQVVSMASELMYKIYQDPSQRYQSATTPDPDNKNYLDEKQSFIENKISIIESQLPEGVKMDVVKVNDFELIGPEDGDLLLGYPESDYQRALYLHYNFTILLNDTTHQYYRHEGDKFVKRNFTVELKIEDYLPVLDCLDKTTYPIDLDGNELNFNGFYYYKDPMTDPFCSSGCDMLCYTSIEGVHLYTCIDTSDPATPGIPNVKNIGLGENLPPPSGAGIQFQCGSDGFVPL